ncbi:hypothetical protein FDU21_01065 [Xanthomonas oryzae pv. oryzae]|nr:hypothetical protein FDU21_01065 [Xanthomonas oryzae pv. oryzae]
MAAWVPPRAYRTYLQRVPRWWAGKGPAAKPQTTHDVRRRASHQRNQPELLPTYLVMICGQHILISQKYRRHLDA